MLLIAKHNKVLIMEFIGKVRKTGDSIWVAIPEEIVEAQKIRENDSLRINVEKLSDFSDVFGKFKTGKSAQKIKDVIRKELWGIE